MTNRTININVPVLARVEGEGALDLRIEGNRISELKLRIFEPPRYFEKLLEGRDYTEVPDIVARICGICPVAYQMSAVHALESIFNVQVTQWVRAMRRLFYCGEWLQSHSLHIHMLAVPDFVGVNSVIELAQDYPDEVRRGLRLQSLGNELIRLMGARSVHPVGACVGGFFKAPDIQAVESLRVQLQQAMADADALLEWLITLPLPDDEQPCNQVSLRHEHEYPMNAGRIISSTGLDIAVEHFDQHFQEHHEPHSTALHCLLDNRPYLVGPLARLNNNSDHLPATTAAKIKSLGITLPLTNMFHSIIARAVEIHFAVHEALRLLEDYTVPDTAYEPVTPVAGIGYGCTEAPRGLLWHRYETDDHGLIRSARIVPPTSQNQSRIEQDLKHSLQQFGFDKDESAIRHHAETVIRNYDPCISCATHFLKVSVSSQQRTLPVEIHESQLKNNIVVIGIGSPHPGDQAGWQVVQRLTSPDRGALPKNIRYLVLDRPGLQLRDYLADVDVAVLIDAVTGVGDSIVSIDLNKLSADSTPLSGHEIGLATTLALLSALAELPPATLIYGIAAGSHDAVVDEAARRIQNCLNQYL